MIIRDVRTLIINVTIGHEKKNISIRIPKINRMATRIYSYLFLVVIFIVPINRFKATETLFLTRYIFQTF